MIKVTYPNRTSEQVVQSAVPEKPGKPGFLGQIYKDRWVRPHLIKNLYRLVKLAQDHEANGVVKGADPFRILNKQANELVDAYTLRYDIDRKELVAQLPALRELARLASHLPDTTELAKARENVQMVVLGVLAIMSIGVAIGFSSGLGRVVYAFICKHFGG